MSHIGELPVRVKRSRKLDPRLVRLFGWLCLGALLRLMTVTTEGTATDHTLVLDAAFKSTALIWWLLGAVAVWALTELWRARKVGTLVSDRTTGVRKQWRTVSDRKLTRQLALLALVLAALIIPNLMSEFYQRVLVDQVAVFVLLAVGLNVVVGWSGLLDLGYVAFFAIGAYTTAYFTGSLPEKSR